MYKFSRFIFEVFIRILFEVHFFGQKNVPKSPYIAASNHASLLDPPLVGIACKKDKVDFMAKEELFNMPILGIWMRSAGCIKVRRASNSVKSLKEALKRVEKGHVICVFPEGTRSVDGSLQDAKRGVGFLVAKANVPVVPIYIEGSSTAMPRTGGLKPGRVINVFIGKPLYPDDFADYIGSEKKDYEKIANRIMDSIAAMSHEI